MPLRLASLAFACAVALSCAATSAAQDADVAVPPTPAVGAASTELPADRVTATLADYQRWLDELAARDGTAGLATAVVIDDKVVFERTLGYADVATQTPVTPDTVFRLASLSKAFASALTGLLVDRHDLHWHTRLVDVLPDFRLKDTADTDAATVADVLGQRLGLPNNAYDNLLEAGVPYADLIARLAEVDPICAPGACYGYENVAFSLIGNVLAARLGKTFPQLVKHNLFQPLGMRDASYGLDGLESSPSWARPHRAAGNGWLSFTPNETYYQLAPAAGVNASIRDMERWLIAQMGGRRNVLPANLLERLHTPDVVTPSELHASPWRRARLSAAHYALGWRVYTYGGETLIYHAGAVAGYRTMIGFFPRYRAGVVTLWNANGAMPSGLMPMVFDGLLGLPHVDWAGLESPPVASIAPAHTASHKHHGS
ncbi:MAG: class A beta-lactamase-related serine hydrolase [Rhodanobacter sp.]|nr:MAG: class A beta-lactamase-related serine hydrolase [Rhodanobacter sp.]TAM08842.1 MAG: class A beta-lactamase-related serine hydrolase [Rhodanobacter sp.]TAM36884.1 MAG: class A beta-lactamase-related serine hydrolase [Rhodanobacter sp.]